MPSWANRTFSSGEITPTLHVRADTQKYYTGLNLCRNMYIKRFGTAENRQGTGYMHSLKDVTKKGRVIEWVFNNNLSYVIELGDFTMRFIKNGSPVEIAAPAAYNNATTYAIGDFVSSGGINYYSRISGNINNNPSTNPTWWYTLSGLTMEIPTPWPESALFDIKYDQQGDILHLVHIDYPPQKLTRTSDTGWVLANYIPRPDIPRVAGIQLSPTGVAGTILHKYYVTAVLDSYEESETFTGISGVQNIFGVSLVNPVKLTFAAHSYISGDEILIKNTGIPDLDDQTFIVSNVTATTLELLEVDGTAFTPWTGGGGTYLLYEPTTTGTPTAADPTDVNISGTFLANNGYTTEDVRYFNVYKDVGDGIGFIGSIDSDVITPTLSIPVKFFDTGITPDTSIVPPSFNSYFAGSGNYPSTVQFIQQRLAFASTINRPQNIYLSRIGFYDNFTTSKLISENDAINFILSGRSINKVEHLIDATALVALTQGGEFIIGGDQNRTIRATAINANQVGYEGANKLQPIVIGNTIMYVQARSGLLRAMVFNENIQGFDPKDLSRWAGHLFENKTIVDWAFQKIDDSLFWLVMSDGTLVTMTFIIDEGIVAFARHETDGMYESVCVVPENNDDIVYFTVKRTVNGSDIRTTERLAERTVTNIVTDAYFMDSFVSYDGTNTTAITQTLTSAGGWGVDDGPFTLTSSAANYVAGDVGNTRVLTVGTDTLTCTITAFTSAVSVTVTVSKDIPVAFQSVALTTWGAGVDTFAVAHLEGKSVAILADGNVLDQITVAGGSITLPDPAVIVRIGLPYNSDLETLDIEMSGSESFIDRKKRVNNMTMIVENSRGGWVGPDEDHLTEVKSLKPANWNTPQDMVVNGRIESIMHASWQKKGKLFIRQVDPLPLHILGLIPHGIVGG